MHKLEYVCLKIVPPKHLETVCNVSIALFEAGGVAHVHPEHPCTCCGGAKCLSQRSSAHQFPLRVESVLVAATMRIRLGLQEACRTRQHNYKGLIQVPADFMHADISSGYTCLLGTKPCSQSVLQVSRVHYERLPSNT